MRLIILTSLTMIAFAANSILTRLAIDGGHIDPSSFALLRVLAGAIVLGMLMTARRGQVQFFRRERLIGSVSLAAYMAGFSLAYLTLDAGLGALILFGVVQVTMFAHGALTNATPKPRQIAGATIAFGGLLLALWPGAGGHSDIVGASFMIIAGLGWAAYTISGRSSPDPLAATTANFLLCLPFLAIVLVGLAARTTATGVALAILCGGVTSGLGYALWYSVLPRLQQSSAAVIQLSVPIISLIGGALILGEVITPLIAVATLLVIGGIAIAVTAQSAQARRN
ncbi:DMT family transporter [Roseobacter sp. EG26]|uniref:DMT family transporter n=1 Tax=Roseobacter sp. EG26 TaxID=3412477 RepID=UPI003CE4B7C2